MCVLKFPAGAVAGRVWNQPTSRLVETARLPPVSLIVNSVCCFGPNSSSGMRHRTQADWGELMKVEKFPVTIYQVEEGWYVVEYSVIPGCMSQGMTKEEALDNVREAIHLCLEVRREKGMPLTIKSREVEVPFHA